LGLDEVWNDQRVPVDLDTPVPKEFGERRIEAIPVRHVTSHNRNRFPAELPEGE
jgi:hypothetical protein